VRILLAAPLALAASLAAQETGVVYGTVRDAAGHPVTNAAVAVVGTGLRTTADPHGGYRIERIPAGRIVLRVVALGYTAASAARALAAGDSIRQDFTLRVGAIVDCFDCRPLMLSPIVTTAAKRPQSLEEVVPSVALMSDSDIASRAVTGIDEAVDKAPGVQFLNGQINIRGSSGFVQGLGSRVLLLVDGVPANQGDRGGINWDLLPVDDVERIEVVKGAGSALYGSAALGGVVNLITREIPFGFHARLRATGGSYADPPHPEWQFRDFTGTHGGADLTSSYGTDDLRGAVTVGGYHSDGYRQQDRRDHWQLAGRGDWQESPNTRLTVSGSWASDQYQVPLAWCERGTCDDRGQAYQPFKIDTASLGNRTRSDKGYLTAVLAGTPSERLRWQARASWLHTRFTDIQPKSGDDFGVADRYGGELRGEFRPPGDGVVTVGAEAGLSDIASDIFGSHRQAEYAAYGEGERPLGKAQLTTGARIDFLAIDGGALTAVVSPRIGAVLPTGSGIWRASVGRGFRAPSLAERFVSTTVSGFTVVPNPNLQPEQAWTFEVGHARPIGSAVRIDAAVFWTEASKLIEPSVNLQLIEIQFKNVTRARLAGLDLAVVASPLTPRLTTTLSYTFLHARQLAHDGVPQQPLAFRPRHLLTMGADYALGELVVGAEFRYASRFERVELAPLTDPRVAARVLNLRAAWNHGPASVRVLVANALNYLYSYAPRTLEPVRNISATLVYRY
jgi:outer membrane receptor for ferrienterochelin and colicins